MIVVAGIPSEPPIRMVVETADTLDIETIILNPRESGYSDLTIRQSNGVSRLVLNRAHEEIELSRATGIYTRIGLHEILPEFKRGAPHERARIAAWHQILNDWMETTPIPCLNRIKACNSNMSKPFQARIIAECGLDVPETLITNDPEAVHAFRARHGTVIFKSISAHRSIVRKLEGAYLSRLQQIRFLPVQFQEYVEGTDIRVHVIGEDVFATRIESAAQDYRYAASDHEDIRLSPTTIPTDVASACRLLSKKLSLPLCGIDLRQADDGRYICFEANPSPAFSFYEEQTGQPISSAIVRWLAAGAPCVRMDAQGTL